MTLVVDASVAIKWIMVEDGTPAANQLIVGDALAAPDLLFIECANVLRTKARRGDISVGVARQGLEIIDAVPIRSVPTRPHVAAAQAIALELDRSAYDALYLAVALAEKATLITADANFAAAVLARPGYANSVRMLG